MPYVSDRKIPLLCQEPDTFGRITVTMEDYSKWYGVILLHPDGRVENVDGDLLNTLEREFRHPVRGDHNFHPQLLNKIAEHYKGVVDWRAFEMACGRWVLEIDESLVGGIEVDSLYFHSPRG